MSTTNTWRTVLGRIASAVATTEPSTEITLTTGGTTTFAATGANLGKSGTTGYTGMEAVCVYDAGGAGAAPEGESRVIASNSSTTFTVNNAFTTTAANDIMLILQGGVTEAMARNAANDILRNLPLPRYLPLSLVADGDMETSGDGNWAAVGAGTGTKATTAADTLLRQHLAIAGTSDGDGQRSDAFNVYAGETLYVDVALRCDTGEAQVELWDADAAAVISGTQYETNEEGFVRISFQYAVGTTVERISVQVTQNGATALACKLGWVSVLSDRRLMYDLPSTVADAELVDEFMVLPLGSTIADDATNLWERQLQPWPHTRFLRDYAAANSHRVELTRPCALGPLFMFFRATDTVISAMTSTVVVPLEPFVEACLSRIRLAQFTRTSDKDAERKFAALTSANAKAYRKLLDSLNLARPVVRAATQRRVAAR